MFIYNEPFNQIIKIYFIKMLMTQEMIKFKPNSPVSLHTFNTNNWLSTLLSDQEWDVSLGRYQVLEELNMFKNAQTLNVVQLKIRWTRDQQVIKNIQTISFPCLKQLFLNGNNLTTIEPIVQAYLPCLEVLNLKQNEIRHISSLRKCNIPNLRQLSLYKNKICDAEKLAELQCPKLEKIWLNGKLQDGNLIGSICWITKFESKKLKTVLIEHHRRIEQSQATQAIQRKVDHKVLFSYLMQDDRGLNWL